jgi:hypothetical protein
MVACTHHDQHRTQNILTQISEILGSKNFAFLTFFLIWDRYPKPLQQKQKQQHSDDDNAQTHTLSLSLSLSQSVLLAGLFWVLGLF